MRSCSRRTIIIIISPILLILGVIAVSVGMAFVGGYDPSTTVTSAVGTTAQETRQLATLLVRCLLVPFQLFFILLVLGLMVMLVRRSHDISKRVLDPLVVEEPEMVVPYDPELGLSEVAVGLRPKRHVTLTQIGGSLLAAVAIVIAFLLIMGQFIDLTDLAIIVTALTSALAWGARLPVSDLLGGMSNIVENNFSIGDRISYRHFALDVEGIVNRVNLRFIGLRALSGEAVTIPFGEVRAFRNFSRSTFAGVYVTFPVPSTALQQVVHDFEALAPESMALVPGLLEPWRVISQDGILAPAVELSLYGRGPKGEEEALQVALHTAVWHQLQTYDFATEGQA